MNRIDILPDDVLLGIFDFYVEMNPSFYIEGGIEAWQRLVHVCRRWRRLVFGSPRRLNLRLYCTPETPARDTLNVWPALPLIVRGGMNPSGTDNVVAALEKSNRVCEVNLVNLDGWQLEQVTAAMHLPYPELTTLLLTLNSETIPIIPDSFLDGFATRLRHLFLRGIPFPGLPRLRLSPTHLVKLTLYDIPHSGYISPEAIVAHLSVLSSLEWLTLDFQSPQSRPDRETRRPPPSKRSVIPALRSFAFKGVIEYLEDLVTGIDTPQLYEMRITFFNQINLRIPRLTQFINRTIKLGKSVASVLFYDNFARVELSPRTFMIDISCREPDRQLSSIEQVCNSSLHPLPTVEDLYIRYGYWQLVWKNDAIESALWLQLFLPFTAVKNLYLSKKFAPDIAAALQELVGGRITEWLPSLENIFVEGLEPWGPFQEKNWGVC